jgi:hypothetical protein
VTSTFLTFLAVMIGAAIVVVTALSFNIVRGGGFQAFWRERLTAEGRARGLMRDLLTPAEYQQILRYGYLEVNSPSFEQRIYRLPGAGGLVKVFDRGCPVMDLCLQPIDPLPDGDVVVMHKLMIEGNEQEYLQRANRFAPGIISLRYHRL